jgi:hypothetical protein
LFQEELRQVISRARLIWMATSNSSTKNRSILYLATALCQEVILDRKEPQTTSV